ncbi:hypothetical protein RHSIM_Rhsim13G0147500 [Rhododendron simsii]|uniref:Uncharacterized protein n=1 Tax=Rhododendron simsii TaxID=118357 RepID=A0A834FZ69_RHOSS|nr:hypothetical protein RHSIM_Rhsim13G0147500 [Rhododendron simsii]
MLTYKLFALDRLKPLVFDVLDNSLRHQKLRLREMGFNPKTVVIESGWKYQDFVYCMDIISQASNLILAIKMDGLKVVLLVLGILMVAVPCSYGVSVACMEVYDEGRAPAVFRSPECHDWVLSAKAHQNETMNCHEITFLELDNCARENGQEDVRVGVVAVFDGQIGKEASEMA